MPEYDQERFVALVLGMPGTGKSTLAKQLVERLPRSIICDIIAEHCDSAPHPIRNGTTFRTCTALASYVRQRKTALHTFPMRAVFAGFGRESVEAMQIKGEWLINLAFHLGNVVFIGEEVNFLQNSSYLSGKFAAMMHVGRHYGCSALLISRRPQDINTTIREAATAWFIFRTEGARALGVYRDYIDPELIEAARSLPVGKCIFAGDPHQLDLMQIPPAVRREWIVNIQEK